MLSALGNHVRPRGHRPRLVRRPLIMTFTLDPSTTRLLDLLGGGDTDPVLWKQPMKTLLQLIRDTMKSTETGDMKAQTYKRRVKELEQYIRIDLEFRLASCDQRKPYYLRRLTDILQRGVKMLATPMNGSAERHGSANSDASSCVLHSPFGDLSAELLAVFLDFGFCENVDTIMDLEEATHMLGQVQIQLDKMEKNSDRSSAESISNLHRVVAQHGGMIGALPVDNREKLQRRFDDISSRASQIENNVSVSAFDPKSEAFKNYIQCAKGLSTLPTSKVSLDHSDEILSDKMSHAATLDWLYERVDSWIGSSECQIFLLAGREATGKTTFASSVCKRYPSDVIASFFFDRTTKVTSHNRLVNMVAALARQLSHSVPDYAEAIEKHKGVAIEVIARKGWRSMFEAFLLEPLIEVYGSKPRTLKSPEQLTQSYSHKVLVIDGIDECEKAEWGAMTQLLSAFVNEISPRVGLLLTCRAKCQSSLIPVPNENVFAIFLESRAFSGRHIRDVEIYIAGSLGVLLSDEDDAGFLNHAKTDEMTLQDTVDELLRASAGRFDYAVDVIHHFAQCLGNGGQFLSSIKRTMHFMNRKYGHEFERRKTEFASYFRAHRDKEGRSVVVKVIRHGRHLLERSRAIIVAQGTVLSR